MRDFIYFAVMDTFVVDGAFNWTVAWSFLCCVLLVTASVAILFIRDSREKQKLYNLFDGYMGEYIIVLSPKMEFLYGLPLFSTDPFFVTLVHEHSLENFLPAADWIRMSAYFKDVDKHPDMPFVLMFDDGGELPIWYEFHCVKKYYSSVEFHYVCFVRIISKEVEARRKRDESEQKLKLFLESTGDFLWRFDVENRKLVVLTQAATDEFRVIPMPVGEVDLASLIPQDDYEKVLEKLNVEVLKYHETGVCDKVDVHLKVRGYRADKSLVWYSVRCKLEVSRDGRLFYKGVARRMDILLDYPLFKSNEEKDSMLAAMMTFPDVRVFWVDRNFILLGCNQAFSVDLKFDDPKDVIGKPLGRLVIERQMPFLLKKVSDVFETQKSVAWKDSYVHSDQYILFNAVPIATENDLVQKVMCVYSMFYRSEVGVESENEIDKSQT